MFLTLSYFFYFSNAVALGGRAAAIASDIVSPIGFIGPAFVQLVEVDHLRGAVGKADVPQGADCCAVVLRVLEHPITQEQAEALGIVFGYRFLVVGQVEYRIGKVALPIVGEGVDVPGFLPRLHHIQLPCGDALYLRVSGPLLSGGQSTPGGAACPGPADDGRVLQRLPVRQFWQAPGHHALPQHHVHHCPAKYIRSESSVQGRLGGPDGQRRYIDLFGWKRAKYTQIHSGQISSFILLRMLNTPRFQQRHNDFFHLLSGIRLREVLMHLHNCLWLFLRSLFGSKCLLLFCRYR